MVGNRDWLDTKTFFQKASNTDLSENEWGQVLENLIADPDKGGLYQEIFSFVVAGLLRADDNLDNLLKISQNALLHAFFKHTDRDSFEAMTWSGDQDEADIMDDLVDRALEVLKTELSSEKYDHLPLDMAASLILISYLEEAMPRDRTDFLALAMEQPRVEA